MKECDMKVGSYCYILLNPIDLSKKKDKWYTLLVFRFLDVTKRKTDVRQTLTNRNLREYAPKDC